MSFKRGTFMHTERFRYRTVPTGMGQKSFGDRQNRQKKGTGMCVKGVSNKGVDCVYAIGVSGCGLAYWGKRGKVCRGKSVVC